MTVPTPEQHAALTVEGVSVALVSGAGCGKTRVLADRYLSALVSPKPIPLPAVVALTFTEKAARELRERVRRACRDRLAQEPGSDLWLAVRRGLEAAPISTFHGFCAELLRTYAIEAGVEPGFRVLDEALAGVMRRQAVDEALRRQMIQGDEAIRAILLRLGLRGAREVTNELVMHRAGRDYSSWRDLSPVAIAECWRRFWDESATRITSELLTQCAESDLRRIRPEECSNQTLRAELETLHAAFARLRAGELPDLESLQELCRASGPMRSADWPSTRVKDQVRDARKRLQGLVERASRLLRWDDELTGRMAAETQGLCQLACEAIGIYAARKRETGALDFDDLQASALGLLRNGPDEVVEQIRRGVALILVDEFQDTDPTQAEILERLGGERLAEGRLFLVGDVKQSIYAFRGAAPELLGRFRERFPRSGRLQLTQNFRGTPSLIRFANALFGKLFSQPEDRLRPSRPEPSHTDFPPVSLVIPQREDSGEKPSAARRRADEAAALARLLRTRLDAGWTIVDPVHGHPRNAGPGDVAVLLRTHAQATAIERALLEEGFDYHVAGGGTFYAQPEVLDLINLLTAIEDPTDEVALVGLLRSPIFGLSDEALYWLSRSPTGSLAEGLEDPATRTTLPAADLARVERAHALLGRWRGLKDRIPIHELLERTLDESGYEVALLAERHGERMRANCRKLVRVARGFDAYGGLSVADFVERLRADYDDPPRETQEATADELGNAVRILTIHQAKGLEFPIVVLPNLDRDAHRRINRVSYQKELGPILHGASAAGDETSENGRDNPIDWLVRQRLGLAERAEELRIFYVAVTRARDALILSSSRPGDDAGNAPAVRLLFDRFHAESGAFLGQPTGDPDSDCPGIEVVRPSVEQALRSVPSRTTRPKSRLLWIARELDRAIASPVPETAPVSTVFRRPAALELDTGLGSSRGRVLRDLLQRAIEANPVLGTDRPDWDAVIEGSAARLVPAAGSRIASEAVRRLGLWPGIPSLHQASEVRTGLKWQTRAMTTLCYGRTEWAVRESGGWHLVHITADLDGDPVLACDRLRAALAPWGVCLSPVVSTRLVILGPEASREEIWTAPMESSVIETLYAELLTRST